MFRIKCRTHTDDADRWPQLHPDAPTLIDAQARVEEHFAEKCYFSQTVKLEWSEDGMYAFARWPLSSRTEDDPEPFGYVMYQLTEVARPVTV